MNISLDELRGDIDRFIRHEAMRAGLNQEEILRLVEAHLQVTHLLVKSE